ncbi:hypothetical protein P8452_65656 [Trifolium repens]|nr:hypothetical protein P8452_65656 [Trifolium repens]
MYTMKDINKVDMKTSIQMSTKKKERYKVIAITIATFKQPNSTTNQQFPTFLFISSFASIIKACDRRMDK